MDKYVKTIKDGLWSNNPVLVQVLGLCPLLAVTNSMINAIGLSLATFMVVTGTNITVSLVRKVVHKAVRLPIFVMIIAAFTTCAELCMQAFAYDAYVSIGIFIPLIVTNCMILGRAEAFASRNNVLISSLDGVITGLGFAWVLLMLGLLREVVGSGTLFANFDLLFGAGAASWKIVLIDDYQGFIFALLPPGAFIGLGLFIAAKKYLDALYQNWLREHHLLLVGTKRVRVTDKI
jgi:Na+-translocating ferredoxin:NAD+ oxidoreductase subunit E